MSHAIRIHAHGGADQLRWEQVEPAAPGDRLRSDRIPGQDVFGDDATIYSAVDAVLSKLRPGTRRQAD